MATGTHAEGGVHPHVLPIRIYLGVWGALLVLTAITVGISYFDFGTFNLIVAMAVATTKATLVALFFMHLKYDEKFNGILFVSTLGFLAIFFILTLADTMERGRVDALEGREIELVPARPELLRLAEEDGHGDGAAAGHGEESATGAGGAGDTGHGAPADSAGDHGAAADSTATDSTGHTGEGTESGGH